MNVTALVCSAAELLHELRHTLLGREGVERHTAASAEEAQMKAVAARPSLVVVDRDLPHSEGLVSALRQEPSTRRSSIVIASRGDFEPGEVSLLEAGANAILRLPASPTWDDRLNRLIAIPARKEARFPVHFSVSGQYGIHSIPALALNVSLHGMLIECTTPLTVGSEVQVVFDLPHPGESGVQGPARVVRRAGPTRLGLEFAEFLPEATSALEAYLAMAQGGL